MRFRAKSSISLGVLAVLLLTLLAPTASGASPFGPNVRVNDDTGIAVQEHVAAAADTSGNVFVACQDARSGDFDIYFARFADGGSSFGPVPGHTTPPAQTAIVKANELTRIVGPYTVTAVASAQTVIVTAGATTLVKGDYVAASPSVLTASASGGIVTLPPGPASASVDAGASVGIVAAATLRTPASRIED